MPRSFIAGRRDRQSLETAMYSPYELAQIRGEQNEDGAEEDDDLFDGQPDEHQEWADFDPDC